MSRRLVGDGKPGIVGWAEAWAGRRTCRNTTLNAIINDDAELEVQVVHRCNGMVTGRATFDKDRARDFASYVTNLADRLNTQ